jgi:hypothetical protein
MDLWEAAVAGTAIDPEKAEQRRVICVAVAGAQRSLGASRPSLASAQA